MVTVITVAPKYYNSPIRKNKYPEDIFRFVLHIQVIVGHNRATVNRTKKFRQMYKVYTGITILMILALLAQRIFISHTPQLLLINILGIMEYVPHCCKNFFGKHSETKILFEKFSKLDSGVKMKKYVKSVKNSKISFLTMTAIILVMQSVIIATYYTGPYKWLMPIAIMFNLSLNMEYVWTSTLYLKMLQILQYFKKNLKTELGKRTKRTNDATQIRNLIAIYNENYDLMKFIGANSNVLYGYSLITKLPRSLSIVWAVLHDIKVGSFNTQFNGLLRLLILEMLIDFVFLMPTIYAYLATLECDAIKIYLWRLLRYTSDKQCRGETKQLQRTIKAKPISFSICKIVPMDLNLLVMFISILGSYGFIIYNFIALLKTS